jgi:uncharacterized protein YbjT (DUF2867 family)
MPILVVGATGLLGSEICRLLRGAGHSVRALVRAQSSPDRLSALQAAGAHTFIGDLKDPASLAPACEGVSAVISTASSTLSRQAGDSIEAVDRQGQLDLIEAARLAGVRQFVYISIPPGLHYDCPLFQAKREVERAVAASGMEYTVVQANYFMEVWLSPTLGFDFANGRATVYGSGEQPMAWISYRDVAGWAVDALGNAAARNRTLLAGGPENLTPLQVVRIFEEVTRRPFAVEHVPLDALEKQYTEAGDPMSRTFAALMLGYARGCPMDMRETLDLLARPLTTVREYAAIAGMPS